MSDPESSEESAFWNARYAGGPPPWDLQGPPAALTRLIGSLEDGEQRIMVPCAGNGHDAIAWAEAGHQVVAVDFAPRAVDNAREGADRANVELEILQADMFHIREEFLHSFDLVWEQTCLAAIHPDRRENYFQAMAKLLKDQGQFIGLLWNHGRAGGPPYDISVELVRRVSSPWFEMEKWHWVQNSTPSRANEFLVWLRKNT